ncbi:MAG: hypothetical protein HS119_06670 [Flavobacteriales bacterium]|nr:hypothetical protein [Flavobacteriales bacterium]
MKYRLLTDTELKELEEDFKHFLITNHVYDDEWVKLNKANDKKVMELIELFSDIVFEKALKNIKFLEFVSQKNVSAFFCADNEMVLIGVTSDNESIDFTKNALDNFKNELTIYRTTKPYTKSREEEVFALIESGCSIISEERFKRLELAFNLSKKTSQN